MACTLSFLPNRDVVKLFWQKQITFDESDNLGGEWNPGRHVKDVSHSFMFGFVRGKKNRNFAKHGVYCHPSGLLQKPQVQSWKIRR